MIILQIMENIASINNSNFHNFNISQCCEPAASKQNQGFGGHFEVFSRQEKNHLELG
jgi:hypothetical protein